MEDKYILEALQKAVKAAVIGKNLPVKYVGRTFTPPQKGAWLELIIVPNNVIGECWGDSKTYRGLFRLVFHYIMDDSGSYNVMNIARTFTLFPGSANNAPFIK